MSKDLYSKVRNKKKLFSKCSYFLIGKILKDENTLEEYKIEDGVTVHLVKGKSAASTGAPSSTGASESQN